MDRAFGAELYQSLTKWTPMNSQSVLAARQLEMHRELYGSGKTVLGAASEVTIDPNQGYEMASKLMAQEFRHLDDLYRSWKQWKSETARTQNAVSADFLAVLHCREPRLHLAVMVLDLKKINLCWPPPYSLQS